MKTLCCRIPPPPAHTWGAAVTGALVCRRALASFERSESIVGKPAAPGCCCCCGSRCGTGCCGTGCCVYPGCWKVWGACHGDEQRRTASTRAVKRSRTPRRGSAEGGGHCVRRKRMHESNHARKTRTNEKEEGMVASNLVHNDS